MKLTSEPSMASVRASGEIDLLVLVDVPRGLASERARDVGILRLAMAVSTPRSGSHAATANSTWPPAGVTARRRAAQKTSR
jgi:hypothetical protein